MTTKQKAKTVKKPISVERAFDYARGCRAGEKDAELYLHELALNLELLSMPLLGDYASRIREYPDDARIKGKLFGFFGRVKREFARMMMEDAWRASSWEAKWEFTKAFAERTDKGAK